MLKSIKKMARDICDKCRICRREGQKLFLKGDRCYTDKCALNRRNYGPGQNGQKRGKLSEYGTQLREKQKTKAYYGVSEKQFRKYFEMANKSKGITGEVLLQLLERRLDNVIYRLGFASSRTQARMLVTHATFDVNGHKVNIPSYIVREGDVISVREIEKDNKAIKEAVESNASRPVPTWLEKNAEKLTGKVVRLSNRDEIDLQVEEHLIVELYSK